MWKILSFGVVIVSGEIEVLAFASQDGVQLGASVNKDNLVFPEAVEIQATPRFGGESVVGAIVSGIVTRPNGSKVPAQLLITACRNSSLLPVRESNVWFSVQ